MYVGEVQLIKRKKVIHCGVMAMNGLSSKIISICNSTWQCDDLISIGSTDDVTCNGCKKVLEQADEDGRVTLK